MTKIIAVIQARMSSTRLPGKVLKDIGGWTMLTRVVRRVQRAALLDGLVVATTTLPSDDGVIAECNKLNIPCFRGSQSDVLDRYYQTALAFQADVVVRITSDCPFADPEIVDQVVAAFLKERPDFASNCLVRTYPQGLDVEVVGINPLERAWREARLDYQRVHVMPYIYQNPSCFRLLSITGKVDLSQYRWTVDTIDDLKFTQAIYARLENKDTWSWRDVLALLEDDPQLTELNQHVEQKRLEQG